MNGSSYTTIIELAEPLVRRRGSALDVRRAESHYMKRIYVDFNTTQSDKKERVHINTGIHPELLEWLVENMRLIFYDEEMEVEGVVERDLQYGFWCGKLDWSTKRNL